MDSEQQIRTTKEGCKKKSVLEGATGKKDEKRASGVKRASRYC
jgi:hypothetical protein